MTGRRAVIITGLCRSGGAAAAEVCHYLGFAMARALAAPIAPDFRLDWEDRSTTWAMAGNVEAGLSPWADSRLEALISLRLSHAAANGFSESIGFKSPLLSLDVERRLFRALIASGFEVTTVLMTRDAQAIERSIARQQGAAVLRRWNEKIRRAPTQPLGLTLPYEDVVEAPGFAVANLAEALGVQDTAVIARAAARVVAPCS